MFLRKNRSYNRCNYSYFLRAVMVMIFGIGGFYCYAQSATNIVEKCASKLKGASSVTANYKITRGGKSIAGTLLSKGTYFSISSGGIKIVYDGKDMWTYSSTSNEITVWHPTISELAESNPLLYLYFLKDYKVVEQGKASKTNRTFLLTPKRRGGAIKSVKVSLNPSTLLPTSFIITALSETVTITITSIKLNQKIDDSRFKFSRKNYPNAEFSDLR